MLLHLWLLWGTANPHRSPGGALGNSCACKGLTLPSYVWVGGETAKWPNAAEGERLRLFCVCLG